MKSPKQLVKEIETLKNLLIARATGQSFVDNFFEIRAELTQHPLTKNKLPQFLHTCRTPDEFWGFIKPKFGSYAQRREFVRESFDSLLSDLERSDSTPSDQSNSPVLVSVDSEHVQLAWHKALERRVNDPEGAITMARTLLETVCKHILDEQKTIYDDKADLPKLYGLVTTALKLAPSQQTEQIFKQILGGCQAVVEGLGALRNKLGDAHGPGKLGVRPTPRHAELAVNLAGTMATFLIETVKVRK